MHAAAGTELSSLLRRFRAQAGFSQQMLADRALISVKAVSALERGSRKVPYRYTLDRIAEALALTEEARAELELSARRARGMRLEAVTAPAHNLPRQLTSFCGRSEVVKEIIALLAQTPLVSIVGTGGAGKTRVAIAVGNALLNSFADGLWFVDLSPLGDPALVPQALAAVLRVPESPNRSLLETLVAYLARKKTMIIFDNCEHVMPGARAVVTSLLSECPELALLVTSREALTVPGERAYRIPPLAVPRDGIPTPEQALRYGAIELFADRMRAVDSQAAITRENVEPIVEICRRLDGLPLALELAAARTAMLSPSQICERLDRVFDILTGNGVATVPRHRTMRAVTEWSYELLSSQAGLLFSRLAVFAGGFSLESASAVCADERLPAAILLELLSSLVAQSLIAVDFEQGDARYRLLEATRQYALEKLGRHGEREIIARRHSTAFLAMAERFERDWYDAPERLWFREAEIEVDNFRVALRWTLAEGRDLPSGRVLAAALARLWYSIAPVEGRRWVRLAIDCSEDETPLDGLARLYIADAELSGSLGEYKASFSAAQRALQLDALDELQRARAMQAAGSALGGLGRAEEGQGLLETALAVSRRLDNRRMQALVLGALGTARSRCGDVEGARRFYADALAYYEALNLERPAASIAGNLAEVEFAAGDAAAAVQLAEEARAGHEATQNRRAVANDLCNMAAYLIALNCFDDAHEYARQALFAVRDVRQTVLTAFVLQHLAAVAILQPQAGDRDVKAVHKRAALLLGFVDAWLTKLEARREYTERQEYERVVAALRATLGDRLDSTLAHGAEWTESVAVAAALEPQ